ncbi:hypothetical protein QO010_002834 [Caulobacter ginsengisoli]|uniref:Uncharacterized protein n=1 Tax=Caulobacter ginsengisoli TaxID=400775 RepID=A0ABU0ISU6_9CAUL|nr:hypothetical protein [Caulobacter ginsengisoli]
MKPEWDQRPTPIDFAGAGPYTAALWNNRVFPAPFLSRPSKPA